MMPFARSFGALRWTRWWQSVRLRDVIVVCLVPVCIGIYLVAAAIQDYRNYRQFDDSWSSYEELNTFFVGRFSAAFALPKLWELQRRLNPEKPDPGIVRLAVAPELWTAWQAEPLALIDQWNDATLIQGKDLLPVRLRKRGDNSVHWVTAKKSFTLATRKGNLFKGYSRLSFSAKTVLQSHIVARLAGEFDLLAPFTTVAPVFVNEKFYGIFRVGEIIDESFLLHQKRMPGNVFRGDNAERGEVYKGLPRGLSVNPYIWDRVVKDRQLSSNADATLQAFLADSNGTTFDDHLRLMGWVNQDEIARLLALMLVVGDPIHLSDVNNNFWYEDPSSGLLHPIPWDFRLIVLEVLQNRNYRVSRLMAEFLRNPFVLDGALRTIQRKIAGDSLLGTAEKAIGSVYDRYREHFEYDIQREPFTPYVGKPQDVLHGLRSNLRLLNGWINDSTVAFHAEARSAGSAILDFEARGYAGNDLHAIIVDGESKSLPAARLVADRNRNGVLDPADQEISGKWTPTATGAQLLLAHPMALIPGLDPDKAGIQPAPVLYRFFLVPRDAKGSGALGAIRADLRNRLTGKPATVVPWRAGAPVAASASWHPWQYPIPVSMVHRLSGDTHLRETLIIPKQDTLIIEAGSTIRLARDVSILSYGRVVARGTKERPIVFRPAVERQPWGTFALQGEGANGSELDHVRFSGGGGALLKRVEYRGMVTIHWAKGVLLKNCELADNVRSDDTLKAVHSEMTIENCTFLRANADAVGFNYSSGAIINNRFVDSAGDAIELMASAPQIIGNQITGAGDKGIFVSQESHPIIFSNHIARNSRGIEVNDGSEPVLVQNRVVENDIGVVQSTKHSHYGSGGWAKLVNSPVTKNKTDIKSDKDSRLTQSERGSTKDDTPPPADVSAGSGELAWIFAHYGIRPGPLNGSGQVDSWTRVEPIRPRVFGKFADNFAGATDGWVGGGGLFQLEKRNHDLQATIRRGRGQFYLNVDWDLSDPKYTYLAVFELAGKNLKNLRVAAVSPQGEAARSFEAGSGLSEYRFITLELKPGRYSSIKVSAEPKADTGRVNLHSYRLYAIPKESSSVS